MSDGRSLGVGIAVLLGLAAAQLWLAAVLFGLALGYSVTASVRARG